MKMYAIAAVLIMLNALSFSQEQNTAATEKLAEQIAKESTYYGLIVGINEYADDSIPDLANPVRDAEALFGVLTSGYGFEKPNTSLLKNAAKEDIISALEECAATVQPADHLLIYFAGHGDWDPDANEGYWLPSNSDKDFIDEWISISQLLDLLKGIHSKHTLVIVDAGFSGSVFQVRSAFSNDTPTLEYLYETPSRKAMTSGSLTIVPDQSVFSRFLIQRLMDNEEPVLTSEQLFGSFLMDVINNSEAIPQYGVIDETGDQGGAFVFLRSKQAL